MVDAFFSSREILLILDTVFQTFGVQWHSFSFLVILIFILNPDLLFIGSYPQGSPAHPASFLVM